MKNTLASLLSKSVAFIAACILAVPMGLWMTFAMIMHQIISFTKLTDNLKSLSQVPADTVDAVTKDRPLVLLTAAFTLFTASTQAQVITQPQIAIPLALASLIGLGFVGLRGIEHAASNSNEFTRVHKLVGNLSAGMLAALIASFVNPTLLPAVLGASMATGFMLALFSTLRQTPRALAILLAVVFGCLPAYANAGALGVAIVLVGAVYQLDSICGSVEDVQKRAQDEYALRSGQASYALGFTLLLTAMAAVPLTLIAQLLH